MFSDGPAMPHRVFELANRALMLTCDSARTPSGDHVGAFRRRPLARKTKNEHTPFEVGGPELDLRRHAWTQPISWQKSHRNSDV